MDETRKRIDFLEHPCSHLGLPGYVMEQFPVPGKGGITDPIEFVLFDQFDQDAQMPIRVMIHWTRTFKYILSKWPAHGSVRAVITRSGRMVSTETLTAHFDSNHPKAPRGWDSAPDLLRKTFRIVDLSDRAPLLQLKFHAEWMFDRDDAKFFMKQVDAMESYIAKRGV